MIEIKKDKKGEIIYPKKDMYIFNKENNDFGMFKQYTIIEKDDKTYLVDLNIHSKDEINDEMLIENYTVSELLRKDAIIKKLSDVEDMRNYVDLNIVEMTSDTHIFNKVLYEYLKSFPYFITNDIKHTKDVLKAMEKDTPLNQQRVEYLFDQLGVTYVEFFDFIKRRDDK